MPSPGVPLSRSIPYRKAASVFPEPVGAWISVCSPEAIAGQPSSCAGVGPAKAPSNQARVRGLKTSSAAMPQAYVERLARSLAGGLRRPLTLVFEGVSVAAGLVRPATKGAAVRHDRHSCREL